MSSVLQQIKSRYSQLSDAETKISDFILANPEKVIECNISELAALVKVSNSTIVRFSQKVGFNGYQQMRLFLTKEIGRNNGKEKIPENDSVSYVISKMNDFFASINYFDNQISMYNVTKAIVHSDKIILIASGNTIPLILDFEFRLNRLGYNAVASSVLERTLNYINNSTENTVLIAISKSGTSKSVIDAVELSKKKRHNIISITGDLNSPLVEISDGHIYSGKISDFISEYHSGIDSHLGEQLIIDIIILLLKVSSGGDLDSVNEITLLVDKL